MCMHLQYYRYYTTFRLSCLHRSVGRLSKNAEQGLENGLRKKEKQVMDCASDTRPEKKLSLRHCKDWRQAIKAIIKTVKANS